VTRMGAFSATVFTIATGNITDASARRRRLLARETDVEVVSQVLNRVAGRMLAANDQAELHCPDASAMPISASSSRVRPLIPRLMPNMTMAPVAPTSPGTKEAC